MKKEIKKYLGIISCATLFGLACLANPSYSLGKETEILTLTEKAEKVINHLESKRYLRFETIVFGDVKDFYNRRTCLVYHDDSKDKEEFVMAISKKGAIQGEVVYFLAGKIKSVLCDFKDNGYGGVDRLYINGNENLLEEATEERETANKIYELVLDEYDKQIIHDNLDVERFKKSGEKLERLIESLESARN